MKTHMRVAALVAALGVLSAGLTGCGDSSEEISVITREDGSGTRGAFIEICGIEEDDVDNTVSTAEVTNSTAVMLTTVAGNTAAIGYVSMGSLDDTVKAVSIEGVEATTENVENGTYGISRPFNLIISEDGLTNEAAQDFFNYIMSADAAEIISEEGYIPVSEEEYESSGVSGEVVVAGSSSVTPVMTVLKEAYEEINPDVSVSIEQSDSTTGVTSTQSGICDIGMASRDLKDTETGVTSTVLAMDGIAVIVNTENEIDDLTIDQVKQIYVGEITDWSSLTSDEEE